MSKERFISRFTIFSNLETKTHTKRNN